MAHLSKAALLGIRAARMKPDQDSAFAIRHARPHLVYFSGAGGWIAFVSLVAVLILRHNDLPRSTDWAIIGWSILGAAVGVVGPLVRWFRTSIDLDGASLRCTTGVMRRRTLALDLEQVREVTVEQDGLGRWLDYGYLRVVDASGNSYVFPPVGNVAALRSAVTAGEPRLRTRRNG